MEKVDFRTIRPVSFTSALTPEANTPGENARAVEASATAAPTLRFFNRIHRRRAACLARAVDVLERIPKKGEALHAVMTGFYDLMHLILALLEKVGSPCLTMHVATLSLSVRNVQEMANLIDEGKVGSIGLLTSDMSRKYADGIFAELLHEFSARGQRVAAARSHAKVITIALKDGRKFVLEGSANLRTCRNIEQFCLIRDARLFRFWDRWLVGMIDKYAVTKESEAEDKARRG